MRQVVSVFVAIGCVTTSGVAFQAGQAATSTPAVRACSILTREMVVPLTENKKVLDLIPPSEESMGSGSACNWGGVRLQLFPSPRAKQNRTPTVKDLQPVSGAGEAAYFRNNRDTYAELMVWTETHYLTLQVSVPRGSTAEATKPGTIALANAIIAKLR